MSGWYYKIFGVEFGPVKLEKLVELAKTNAISRDDVVRFSEKGNWRKVGSIGQLMAHLPFESTSQKVIGKADDEVTQESAGASIFDQPSSPLMSDHPTPTDAMETVDTDRRWWCKIQDREYGPVELPKLIEWAATGRLLPDDQVRFGNDPYALAKDLPGLFPERPTKMAPPPGIPGNPATI